MNVKRIAGLFGGGLLLAGSLAGAMTTGTNSPEQVIETEYSTQEDVRTELTGTPIVSEREALYFQDLSKVARVVGKTARVVSILPSESLTKPKEYAFSPSESVELTPIPTPEMTEIPTKEPAPTTAGKPEITLTPEPSKAPTISLIVTPTIEPTRAVTVTVTVTPMSTPKPTLTPTPASTNTPTPSRMPTATPKAGKTPTNTITPIPTKAVTQTPTQTPTKAPTKPPTPVPTMPPEERDPHEGMHWGHQERLVRRTDIEAILFRKVNELRVANGLPKAENPYLFDIRNTVTNQSLGDWMTTRGERIAKRNVLEGRSDHEGGMLGVFRKPFHGTDTAEYIAQYLFDLWCASPNHYYNLLTDITSDGLLPDEILLFQFVVYDYCEFDGYDDEAGDHWANLHSVAAICVFGNATEENRIK